MRKISVFISLLVGIAIASVALAQVAAPDRCTIRAATGITQCDTSCPVGNQCIFDTNYGNPPIRGALCCMFSSMNYIINWIFMILMVLSAIVVIYGAVTLTTAAGAPDKVAAGKNLIVYAVIGFAVALLSRGIPGIVRTIMGIT